MTKDTPSFRPVEQYTGAIERSNHFLEAMSEDNDFVDSRRRAFGKAALGFVSERRAESPYLDLDIQAVRILGLSHAFLEANHTLDELRQQERNGETVSRSEKISHIQIATQFNHALRELIDTQPQLTPYAIVSFIEAATLKLDGVEESKYMTGVVMRIVRSMQQEVVAEQALWTIPGVEDVVHANEEEDMAGIDLKVIYNGEVIPLDITSTEESEKQKNNKAYARTKSVAAWTGISVRDLKGQFRAETDVLSVVAARLQAALDTAPDQVKSIAS